MTKQEKEKIKHAIRLLTTDLDCYDGGLEILWQLAYDCHSPLYILLKDVKAVTLDKLPKVNSEFTHP